MLEKFYFRFKIFLKNVEYLENLKTFGYAVEFVVVSFYIFSVW